MTVAVDRALVRENWQAHLIAVYTVFGLLRQLPLQTMVDMGEEAQAIGPLLHPTAWREKGDAAQQDLDTLQAALTFVRTVEADYKRAGFPLPDVVHGPLRLAAPASGA
jgi:hypothetical protein